MLYETFSVIFKHRVLCKVEREETTYIIRVPAKKEYVSDKVFILLMYFYTSTLGTWELGMLYNWWQVSFTQNSISTTRAEFLYNTK